MRIDSSGNVGFGVIPKAGQNSQVSSLQLSSQGMIQGFDSTSNEQLWVGCNNYYASSGGDKYIETDPAARIAFDNLGSITSYVAPSGTADTAITWVNAMAIANSGSVVFNEGGIDADFRVESDGETHCFFVNGNDSKIGINRSAPAATLDVRQLTNNDTDGVVVRPLNETQTCTYSFVGPMATYFMQYVADSANTGSNNYHNFCVGGTGTNNQLLQLTGTATTFNEGGLDRDFRVESDTNTHALFVQGSDGNVGIGDSTPNFPLSVNGAISESGHLKVSMTKTGAETTTFTITHGSDGSWYPHSVFYNVEGTTSSSSTRRYATGIIHCTNYVSDSHYFTATSLANSGITVSASHTSGTSYTVTFVNTAGSEWNTVSSIEVLAYSTVVSIT